jgi:actin-like ATPase involved in cell morphogenesis
MFGLCEAIADALKVPCSCAEDPQTNVVIGCGKAVENRRTWGSSWTITGGG